MAKEQNVCVVVGVGPGNGAAFARQFSNEGYKVALLARSEDFTKKLSNELKNAKHYICDVTQSESINKTCKLIQEELGNIEVLIYNAGSGTWGSFEEIKLSEFEQSWKVNALGLLAFSQNIAKEMQKNNHGSIIIVGASASRRGKKNTTAFAAAKAAQRSLAESLAKDLWPKGVHVALIIIDGVVNLETTREHMKDKPDSFFVNSEDVAATALWLTKQGRSAWSFEVEARPFGENW